MPHLKKISLLSDNAACYQNTMMLILIPKIGLAHGIIIIWWRKTETQDGKSVLDGHFAIASKIIIDWVKEGSIN